MGNGGAMRVAPLGGYFADNLERCAEEARASSVVTHTHPEGVAGAIAVAVAAAMAWQLQDASHSNRARSLFEAVLRFTPESQVRQQILKASTVPSGMSAKDAARVLGNGSLVTASDTVPFCIWMAAHQLAHFVDALGQTISVGGDCDTNAAIVGGIVALSAGRDGIPAEWVKIREPVQIR
jgi:ADP-ribosylglycohydrolase